MHKDSSTQHTVGMVESLAVLILLAFHPTFMFPNTIVVKEKTNADPLKSLKKPCQGI